MGIFRWPVQSRFFDDSALNFAMKINMISKMLCLVLVAASWRVGSTRELLQDSVPAPAPGPTTSTTYTVPNWKDGVKIDNATLPVGGTLSIPWSGRHGVYQVASYACPASFPTPNPNGLVAPSASNGNFKTTFDTAGVYYFVCQ